MSAALKWWTLLCLGLLATACDGSSTSDVPKAKPLSAMTATEFASTPLHAIQRDRNAVYCSTLLIAWDALKDEIGAPLQMKLGDVGLKQLNAYTDHRQSLLPGEYSHSSTSVDQTIKVHVSFEKNLEFEFPFAPRTHEFLFNGVPVEAFEAFGSDDDAIKSQIDVRYYLNQENWIVALYPLDREHEIILYRTSTNFETLEEAMFAVEHLSSEEALMRNTSQAWRYSFLPDDYLAVPNVSFNLEYDYPELCHHLVYTTDQQFQTEVISQRTAFTLNHRGAHLESEAEIELASEAGEEGPEKPEPKIMQLDRPGFVMLKRRGDSQPYFALWLANPELLLRP